MSFGFPRQEYWNGLPFPSPEDLPDPCINESPASQTDSSPSEPSGKPRGVPLGKTKYNLSGANSSSSKTVRTPLTLQVLRQQWTTRQNGPSMDTGILHVFVTTLQSWRSGRMSLSPRVYILGKKTNKNKKIDTFKTNPNKPKHH